MDFSSVYDDIGDFGPYQCAICLLLASSMIPACFSNLNTVFIMGVTEYWCAVPELNHLNSSESDIKQATIPVTSEEGEDVTYDECNVYVRNYSTWDETDVERYQEGNIDNATTEQCQDGWVFDTAVYGDTATTDFELVCDKRWWQAGAASAYALGMFVALLIYGTIADRYGRRPVLCWSTILFIICNLSTAFSPNEYVLIVTRFLCGFFSAPFYGGTFVLVVELIGPRWRGHVNAWYGYFWPVAGLTLCGLAYAIDDWRYLQITLSIIMSFYVVYFWIPESPRWLCLQQRKEEADIVFERIAKSNKRTYNPDKLIIDQSNLENEEHGYIWHMFATKSLALRSCVMSFNWFAASLCYYGLTFASTSLGSNEYASFALSMVVEVPAIVLCHIITVNIGRRLPLLGSMILGGICLLCTMAFEPESTGVLIFVNLGKISCTMAFNLLYVYVVEVYPTVIRSVASSSGNFCARMGSILAPFIAQLSNYGTYLPFLVFGTCTLLAGLLSFILPETINKELEDSLEITVKETGVSNSNNKSSNGSNGYTRERTESTITKL